MSDKEQYTPKGLTFQPCDEKLVIEIIKYQERNGLPTFVAAVRQLCNLALESK
ncbi:MAG: hypothetical protein IJ012_05700 [Clostridia bacterium]|nr:hypothetical protein [Clostridia bacterium]